MLTRRLAEDTPAPEKMQGRGEKTDIFQISEQFCLWVRLTSAQTPKRSQREQELVNLFSKEPDKNILGFLVEQSVATTQPQHNSSPRRYPEEWAWLCFNKTLFTKTAMVGKVCQALNVRIACLNPHSQIPNGEFLGIVSDKIQRT